MSLRQLGPAIGDLAGRHPPLNNLSREALAAAVTLQAAVLMAEGTENRTLAEALTREGLQVDVLPT